MEETIKTSEMEEEKKEKKATISPSKMKTLWDSGTEYKKYLNLIEKWKTNDRFFAGEQWPNIPTNVKHLMQMPTPVMNIVRQTANTKTSAIKSEGVKMIFSSFGSGASTAPALAEPFRDMGDMLTKMTEATWENSKLDSISARAVDRAAMTGIGIVYVYWDLSKKGTLGGQKYIGDIRAKSIDAMYVVFGNPQELDVQEQPYIIVVGRVSVADARALAKTSGASASDLERINGDESTKNDRYQGASQEDRESEMVTIYTKFERENGTIWYSRTTESAIIEEKKNLKLKLYPFAAFNWEERMDCIYGTDAVSSIIPNQKLINGLLAMNAMSAQLTGFPKLWIDKRYIDTRLMTNIPGEIITSTSKNLPTGHVPIQYIQPAQQTNAVGNLVDMIMQKTKDISGANEAVTGEANTNNASAIMLLQKSAGMPNQDIRRRYYQYIEDMGNILVDHYKTYYTIDRMMQYKNQGNEYELTEFNSSYLDGLEFSIRSDVGASSVFGDSNTVSTLDKLLQLQMIDKVTYVKLLPKAMAPFKEELLSIYTLEAKLREDMQKQEAIQQEAIQEPSIAQEMQSAIPPEQGVEQAPERTRLQEEYGKPKG